MNTEELELSLRTEFETYLNSVISELRQETAEFQNKVQEEFDRQRALLDDAFGAFLARFESKKEFGDAFLSSVSEHLRLARDEGAKITAEAIAEAEKLEKQHAVAEAVVKYDVIRDAVKDISSQESQVTTLKALIGNAAEFAPRGAFFTIKSGNFVGWKVFGANSPTAEAAISELNFPVSADTVLGAAARSLTTIEASAGVHSEDALFLDDLGFGRPERMYAIPLIARGKAVAVLYADPGSDNKHLQHEALETLVRVTGMTVELLAAQGGLFDKRPVPAAAFEDQRVEDRAPEVTHSEPVNETPTEDALKKPAPFVEPESSASEFVFRDTASTLSESQTREAYHSDQAISESARTVINEPEVNKVHEPVLSSEDVLVREETASEPGLKVVTGDRLESPEIQTSEIRTDDSPQFTGEMSFSKVERSTVEVEDFQPETSNEPVYDFSPVGSPFETRVKEAEPEISANDRFDSSTQPSAEVPPAPAVSPGPRLSDRNVDLPIEVPEEERRSHNDARRFARLLVSEIKLYNEKKVIEGREAGDLYQRLREAIDRSREMYEKRVQPSVASKFDYFHYELVNSLAEGDGSLLGADYPGAFV